jgi:putative membrane protein
MCYWHEGVGPWMVVGGVAMFLFWAGLIALTAWGVARLIRRSHSENAALAIARERYARGEIGKEEFDRIKKDLS